MILYHKQAFELFQNIQFGNSRKSVHGVIFIPFSARKGLREGGKQKLEQSINKNLDNQKIVKGEINGSFSILFKGCLKYIKSQTLTIS